VEKLIIEQVNEYRKWLLDPRTTVMGDFVSPRQPTKHIIAVIVASCVDQEAIGDCQKHDIILFGPSGSHQGTIPDSWPSNFRL
jgi:hypothetical protein